jgi:LysM repeat protein
MKPTIAPVFIAALLLADASLVRAQTASPAPAATSVEARLDGLVRKLDEQNVKIDLLSQQILKLQQQLAGNPRPGVIIGEAASSPTPPSAVTTTNATTPAPSPALAGTSHVVARGETLTSIAKANSVSISELQKYNHIDNPLKLQAGQTIVIPPSPTPSASTSAE